MTLKEALTLNTGDIVYYLVDGNQYKILNYMISYEKGQPFAWKANVECISKDPKITLLTPVSSFSNQNISLKLEPHQKEFFQCMFNIDPDPFEDDMIKAYNIWMTAYEYAYKKYGKQK